MKVKKIVAFVSALFLIVISMSSCMLLAAGALGSGSSKSKETSEKEEAKLETESETEKTATIEKVIDMTLPDAVKKLRSAGFSNIEYDKFDGWDEARLIVTEQEPDPDKEYPLDQTISLQLKKLCIVSFNLTSEANLMFSRYDIEVYVDDSNLGTASNGQSLFAQMDLLEGKHELKAVNAENNKISATKRIDVTGNMTFTSDMSHDRNSIEFRNAEITEGIDEKIKEASSEKTEEGNASEDTTETAESEKIMINVVGMVLSDAEDALHEAGYFLIDYKTENGKTVMKRSNWIVKEQSIEPGEPVSTSSRITLTCGKLDDYFSDMFAGKTLDEAQRLAEEDDITLGYYDNKTQENITDIVNALSEEEKKDWRVVRASNNVFEHRTASLDITYTGDKEEQSSETKTERKYDLEKNLVVTRWDAAEDLTNMFYVEFSDYDEAGALIQTYFIDGPINPREMGKQFNVIGDLPEWFFLGATVHVKADLIENEILSLEVTEAENSASGTIQEAERATEIVETTEKPKPEMPIMIGTNVDVAEKTANSFGLKADSDEDFGHGTKMRPMQSSSGGLMIDIIYNVNTKEILSASIITNKLATSSEQSAFIIGMAPVLCPVSDSAAVSSWVSSNIDGDVETTINGFVYELGHGIVDNMLYSAGERNWEEWELSH